MCLEQDDIFTFSTGKKVPKGQLSEADQKMCTRILFELYAKVRFLHMNLFVDAIIALKNVCYLKQNIFFLQYPESVMFRDCSDLNFKEYLDVIKEPIAMDVIKEKLDRDNPEMVSVNQGCLMLSQIQFTTVHAQL